MGTYETDIRVRYQETDNMGVVYYSNYFVWFEIARTEHLRKLGISYRDDIEAKGLYMMVVEASCRYRSPARYDDVVRIQSSIPSVKNSSMKFEYKLFVGERAIATGETTHALTNSEGKPVRIGEELKEKLL